MTQLAKKKCKARLAPGVAVQVTGLKGRGELNGKIGTLSLETLRRAVASDLKAENTAKKELVRNASEVEEPFAHTVKQLCAERSVEIEATDSKGRTALLLAVETGHIHIVKYLCGECHASVDGKPPERSTMPSK